MMYSGWITSGWMVGGTLLACVAIISLAIFFVFSTTNPTRARRDAPLAVAEQRFAADQITATELETLRGTAARARAQTDAERRPVPSNRAERR